MNRYQRILTFALSLVATAGLAQYPNQQVAFGDGTSTLVSHGSFKYNSASPQLTIVSPTDNYLTMINGAGAAHLQYDQYGNWVWWTPLNGNAKMQLLNEGQLRLGTYAMGTNVNQAPLKYSLVTSGGVKAYDQITVEKQMAGSATAFNLEYGSSSNTYQLEGTTANTAYHFAQSNILRTKSATNGVNDVMSGYQSAAQTNTVELNNQTYSDQGAGQVWSVQTNSFNPISSTVSKYINTYIRTQLGYGNTIGSYYSLFLEAPIGAGSSANQITNYYGVYQESAVAKNFFGGKMWIGSMPSGGAPTGDAQLAVNGKMWVGTIPSGGSVNSDAQLAVNGNIYCSRLRVLQTGWADYVFEPGYQLPTLPEVEAFIKANGHLPGVASADQIAKEGNDVGESQKMLLQKVEELTLYLIDLKKEVEQLKKENTQLKNK